MNKEQKADVVERVATLIEQAEAVIAVDYRGINVPQVNELRMKLRDADATFRIVKNSLTELAADKAGEPELKALLDGPTAFTFVRGDLVMAAKALNKFVQTDEVISFRGGYSDGTALTAEQLSGLAKLPTTDQLRAQLVGTVFSPVTTVVRGLNSMIGGLAVALAELQSKRGAEQPAEVDKPEEPSAEEPKAAEVDKPEEPKVEEPKAEEPKTEETEAEEPKAEEPKAEEPEAEEPKAEENPDLNRESDESSES